MSTIQPSSPSALNSTVAEATKASFTDLPLYRLSLTLWTVWYPLILVMGTFGNVTSIVIMWRLMTAQSTVNLFFIALAGGDLIVLYSGGTMKLLEIAVGIDNWPGLFFPVLCLYLSSGGFVSWILVCMTLQRALSVAWPHHVSRLFTRGRVVRVIVGVAAFKVVLHAHHLYCLYVTATTSVTSTRCLRAQSSPYVKFLGGFIYLATALTSVLPFVCLVLGNGVLVTSLITSVTQARRHTAAGNRDLDLKRKKDTGSVTVTIIAVSFTFIVLTLPVFVHSCLFRFTVHPNMSAETRARVFLFYTVSSLMNFTNNAVNFILYCLTGRRFREEFVRIISCQARKK